MHTVSGAGGSLAPSVTEPRTANASADRVAARVAIAGATGYTGQELLRLLSRHPSVSLTAAMSSGQTGASSRRLPALSRLWDGAVVPLAPETLKNDADVVFLALPDAAAAGLAPALVATPGCYPTATLLALAPLAEAGLLVSNTDIVVDAKSGVSGAGKTPSERTHFSEIYGSLAAYGVFNHRHGAEIEQGVGRTVTFTPHLVPIDRGILSTIYVRVAPGTTEEALGDVYEHAYKGATFVRLVGSALPEIKHVAHTNFCDVGWRVDASGRAILVSVIDNLLKGASGQAVQNLNVMLGIDERTGLSIYGKCDDKGHKGEDNQGGID